MAKNKLTFGRYKISERKRVGKNPRVVFYLTPIDQKLANIEDYSEKYLIAIRRNASIERYPECFPSTLTDQQKLDIIDHLKLRSVQLEKSNIEPSYKEPDFDLFEDVFELVK
jgi:hypothetical protein